MRDIEFSEHGGLLIGGAVSLNEIIDSKVVKENYPILVTSAKTLANHQLRNRATMMGNICNASPAGDMLAPALVLKGVIEAVSVAGTRQIPLKDFFLGVKKNVLKENELAVRILFPPIKGKGEYLRRSRIKGHDLAQIGVAAFIRDGGGISLALGSVAPVPVLIEEFQCVTNESYGFCVKN
jgi:CO/xanthine dehydrogenase FAD-binding subunit